MKLSITAKVRLWILAVFLVAITAGTYVYPVIFNTPAGWFNKVTGQHIGIKPTDFRLGLDLQGGTHLVYQADVSKIAAGERSSAIDGVRDVIERRVNAFGVSEPLIQTSGSGDNYRVVVELAGVKDVDQAIKMIGETPLLEFKTEGVAQPLTAQEKKDLAKYNTDAKKKAQAILKTVLNSPLDQFATIAKEKSEDPGSAANGGDLGFVARGVFVPEVDQTIFDDLKPGEISRQLVESSYGWHIIYKVAEREQDGQKQVQASHILIRKKVESDIRPVDAWQTTALGGKQLQRAQVVFDPNVGTPTVSLQFDNEGSKLFEELTTANVGKTIGIFLDNQPISTPTVNEPISGGQAVISGNFSLPEAKLLAQRLNAGALPVPITLISQQTVGASLGADSLNRSLFAGMIGLLAVSLFMLLYYRLPGLIAVIALIIYSCLVLTIFKFFHITLTLAGIAGFILSIGMAVDANVLIFERMMEELRRGRDLLSATNEGFHRAWPSIRDSNVCTLITCSILFWFSTSLVKGFALTLTIGVIVSMFTAVTISRNLLRGMLTPRMDKWYFLFHRPKPVATDKPQA